ncbi:MAG: tetratricopeptide repeat protein [Gemmatimonadetes bacterium]|nr:tetratricopeptide repeat protein [Gemmatimonadota bacterium]
MYNQLGENDEAERAYLQAIGLRPERPRYYEMLGKLYQSTGRGAEARSYLEMAYRLNPRDMLMQEEVEQLGGIVQ